MQQTSTHDFFDQNCTSPKNESLENSHLSHLNDTSQLKFSTYRSQNTSVKLSFVLAPVMYFFSALYFNEIYSA